MNSKLIFLALAFGLALSGCTAFSDKPTTEVNAGSMAVPISATAIEKDYPVLQVIATDQDAYHDYAFIGGNVTLIVHDRFGEKQVSFNLDEPSSVALPMITAIPARCNAIMTILFQKKGYESRAFDFAASCSNLNEIYINTVVSAQKPSLTVDYGTPDEMNFSISFPRRLVLHGIHSSNSASSEVMCFISSKLELDSHLLHDLEIPVPLQVKSNADERASCFAVPKHHFEATFHPQSGMDCADGCSARVIVLDTDLVMYPDGHVLQDVEDLMGHDIGAPNYEFTLNFGKDGTR